VQKNKGSDHLHNLFLNILEILEVQQKNGFHFYIKIGFQFSNMKHTFASLMLNIWQKKLHIKFKMKMKTE